MTLHAPRATTIVSVTITIEPSDIPSFLSHFRPVYDLVLAEPECLYFIFGQSPTDPGVFHFTEGWARDAGWFMDVQVKKDYYGPYLVATEPMFIKPRLLEIWIPEEGLNNFKLPS